VRREEIKTEHHPRSIKSCNSTPPEVPRTQKKQDKTDKIPAIYFLLSDNNLCDLSPTFAIRTKKRLFLGMNHPLTLDSRGVNFQNGL